MFKQCFFNFRLYKISNSDINHVLNELYILSSGVQRISEANDVSTSNEATKWSNLVCPTDIPANEKLVPTAAKNNLALLCQKIGTFTDTLSHFTFTFTSALDTVGISSDTFYSSKK